MIVGREPIRVLHVIGTLGHGGIETWLMHVFRNFDRSAYQMDVVVHTEDKGAYAEEAISLGVRVFQCPSPRKPIAFARELALIIEDHGPYQIVHSHLNDFSGYVLRTAKRLEVPVRIAHSHSDRLLKRRPQGLIRRLSLPLQRYWISACATERLAASRRAGEALFGVGPDSDWKVLLYGIGVGLFERTETRIQVRRSIGIPEDAFVVGHVGRFDSQKNHDFLIDVFTHVSRRDKKAHLLLVGDGILRQQVSEKVSSLGLEEHVTFLGLRDDVPRLMSSVMDVFVFPSRFEGLGLVLVEAQAAGLPCIFSNVVPTEADVVPELLRRVSLGATADLWSKTIIEQSANGYCWQSALETVRRSPFNIENNVSTLQALYRQSLG